ncbi:MAG TPA: proline--tRNA ligase [Nitrososphaeraceae archaeon]|nr:proline--tRNA ligase [Nitrososphaeraceae archaeon]
MKKEIGITASRDSDFSEWYLQSVIKAGLADYAPAKGFIVLRPYGYEIWEIIKGILDEKLKNLGHQNGFLPTLIPESLLSKEQDHFAGFMPEVFWVTKAGDNDLAEKLAIRPTSETLAYSMFAKWISSHRDLPLKLNFWNSALRAEIKSTKPFIRNSEFLWQEGHTAHTTEEEADIEVRMILDVYKDLVENYLSIPTMSGYKSEKEKFVGAKYTTCLESLMIDGKSLQMATSHQLGQNFAKPFEIKYLGKDMIEHFVWQTSWGISWRLIGAIIMTHGDDKGVIIPPRIAPIQVVIVPIYKDVNKELVVTAARRLKDILGLDGIRAHLDDRDEFTSGWKFNYWETKGVPLRINLGPRDVENNQIELVRRDTKQKDIVANSDAIAEVKSLLAKIQINLFDQAVKRLDEKTNVTSDLNEAKILLETKTGFISTFWCGNSTCEEKIKDETSADIRLIPFEGQDKLDGKLCISCGLSAKSHVILGRAY